MSRSSITLGEFISFLRDSDKVCDIDIRYRGKHFVGVMYHHKYGAVFITDNYEEVPVSRLSPEMLERAASQLGI